ncbi:hypothetical protein EVAR_36665_1 [Eumeta japonica]|uniref:Uncharacterized protein n=1 Tax=Eumeta variegata TaxID=151549 RepID=A0A4C1XZ44_EUMVA|nr:hypothetical protein EVAR_36665_1 [Eumeta japonica]
MYVYGVVILNKDAILPQIRAEVVDGRWAGLLSSMFRTAAVGGAPPRRPAVGERWDDACCRHGKRRHANNLVYPAPIDASHQNCNYKYVYRRLLVCQSVALHDLEKYKRWIKINCIK